MAQLDSELSSAKRGAIEDAVPTLQHALGSADISTFSIIKTAVPQLTEATDL